jgi:hypothetical protein
LPGSDPLQACTHARHLVGRMPDPVDQLTDHTQWLAAAKRLRRVPRELLVGEIGVVFELACRLDDVDSPGASTGGEFGSPGRGVERGGEIDVVVSSARPGPVSSLGPLRSWTHGRGSAFHLRRGPPWFHASTRLVRTPRRALGRAGHSRLRRYPSDNVVL